MHSSHSIASRIFRLSILLVGITTQSAISAPIFSTESRGDGEFKGFVPEVYNRGTVRLVFSCFITSFLCVYSSLHMNVPAMGRSRRSILLAKFLWLLEGILYPEELLSLAISQRRRASAFCRRMNRLEQERKFGKLDRSGAIEDNWDQGPGLMAVVRGWFRRKETTSEYASYRKWSLQTGFYATCGGFAYAEPCTFPPPPSVKTPPPATLGPTTILRLAQAGLFLDFKDAEIADKSKAERLVCALAVFQSTWLLAEIVSRKATGLPVTLLEIHTFIIAIFSLATYALWWHKPRDVCRPSIVPGRHVAGYEKILRGGIPDETKMGFAGEMRQVAPLSGVFAALHIFAWSTSLPSEIEFWVYRGGIAVAVAGSMIITIAGLCGANVPAFAKVKSQLREYSKRKLFAYSVVWAVFFAATCARTVFVVVAVFSLRRVPEGVFEGNVWMAYWPHI